MPYYIYICHPFSNDIEGNTEKMKAICRDIVDENHIPICTPLYFPAFIDEETQRDLAIKHCINMLNLCEVVYIYWTELGLTPGMRAECEHIDKHLNYVRCVLIHEGEQEPLFGEDIKYMLEHNELPNWWTE